MCIRDSCCSPDAARSAREMCQCHARWLPWTECMGSDMGITTSSREGDRFVQGVLRGKFSSASPPGIATLPRAVSYTHLRAHETVLDLVCRLLLEKKKQ